VLTTCAWQEMKITSIEASANEKSSQEKNEVRQSTLVSESP
jgi:hypothetical protein